MVKEGTTLTAQTTVDNELMAAITGEEGFMRAGALPTVPAATKNGVRNCWMQLPRLWGDEIPNPTCGG